MNDFYVHGDVHNYVDNTQAWLNVVQPNRVIWLGDFWDQYGDTPEDARKTALFVNDLIEKRPQDTLIMSNHDVTYRFPMKYAETRYGFTHDKCRALHSVFPRENWDKFEVFHEEQYRGQTVLFSHAGLMFKFCVNGQYDFEFLKRQEAIAIADSEQGKIAPLFDSMMGPLWLRWKFPILRGTGVCQVVGHTPYDIPQSAREKKYPEWNLNMDCAKTWVAHFTENGIYFVHKKTGERRLAKFLNSNFYD